LPRWYALRDIERLVSKSTSEQLENTKSLFNNLLSFSEHIGLLNAKDISVRKNASLANIQAAYQ
jgi:hypothetical protein